MSATILNNYSYECKAFFKSCPFQNPEIFTLPRPERHQNNYTRLHFKGIEIVAVSIPFVLSRYFPKSRLLTHSRRHENNYHSETIMTDATRHRGGLVLPSGGDPLATATRKTMAAASSVSSSSSHAQYLSRLIDFKQMDIQSALDQMKTLLSTRPHVVYKTSYYRKQTKNHWARDDPAFAALEVLFLTLASIAYTIGFKAPLGEGIAFFLYSVFFNWLGLGFIVATIGREIANRYLTDTKSNSHVRQSVEWLYAFDIHCNAFFPVFVLLCK